MEKICPCRLGEDEPRAYAACCGPILDAGRSADSAEALMRSRYSAYALGKLDYLYESLAPESRHDYDRKSVAHWSRSAQWHGLEIVSVEDGQSGDETGFVEFIAHFTLEGEKRGHRERSLFRFAPEEARWYFVEEAPRKSAPVVKGAQPGRNDPCLCGSGKKFKKCCGAA